MRPAAICIFIVSFAFKSLAALGWGGASHHRNGLHPPPFPLDGTLFTSSLVEVLTRRSRGVGEDLSFAAF